MAVRIAGGAEARTGGRGADAAPPAAFDRAFRRRALAILMLAYMLCYLDRQVLTILAEPIKRELHLADWQLGVVSGLAFAIFYTGLGLPIARLAERRHRPTIIAGSLLIWSGFTMMCGLATGFVGLAFARLGVGTGEAGCTPTAHSLISDYVPRERRASALATYSLGVPIGTFFGLALGGLLVDVYGWRVAFIVAGAPGIVLAVVARLVLREPRHDAGAGSEGRSHRVPSFAETFAELIRKPTFWLTALATGAVAFTGYGQSAFISAFFLRAHGPVLDAMGTRFGLSAPGVVGIVLGSLQGFGGFVGTMVGGWLADWAQRRNVSYYGYIPALACVVVAPLYCMAFLTTSPLAGLAFNGVGITILSLWYAPVYTTAQSVVEPHSRATASAFLFLTFSIMGLGMGPLGVGLLSDVLANHFALGAVEGLRWSLVLSTFGLLVAVPLYTLAGRLMPRDIVG